MTASNTAIGTVSLRFLQLCIVCCVLAALSQPLQARCRHASKDDVPYGANEFILEEGPIEVGEILGVVLDPSGAQRHAVVEVYKYDGGENSTDAMKALEDQRIAACITGDDGKFSFPDLPPGRYLLRIGLSDTGGMNEDHLIVRVVRGGTRKKLEIRLRVGT